MILNMMILIPLDSLSLIPPGDFPIVLNCRVLANVAIFLGVLSLGGTPVASHGPSRSTIARYSAIHPITLISAPPYALLSVTAVKLLILFIDSANEIFLTRILQSEVIGLFSTTSLVELTL